MSLRLQIFIAAIIIIMLFFIANMVRKKKIDLRYALSWICLGGVVLIIDIFPQILFCIAEFVGISLPSNMVFFAGFMMTVVMIYLLTVSVSHLSIKNKRLIQEMALLREQVEQYHNEINEK